IETAVADAGDLQTAARLLHDTLAGPVHVDIARCRVTVGTSAGAKALIAAGRSLDDGGIALDDLAIRRPSLDDVFLALTGRATAEPSGPSPDESTVARATRPTTAVPLASAITPSPPRLRALSDIAGVAKRELLHMVRNPQLLAFAAMPPVLFVAMF